MKRIGLIGFSGSGKSSLAHIAGLNSYVFADSDKMLRTKYGDKPESILIEGREDVFREMEDDVILEILKTDASFIAFGGGFHYGSKLWCKVSASGVKLIYLRDTFDNLFSRVADRPMLKRLGHEKYRQLFEERKPLYMRASSFVVDTDKRSADKIWLEVEGIWNLLFQ